MAVDERWWGGRGHLWEQTRLPGLRRRAGADLLLSPSGWGPLTVRAQLPVIHDLHPILYPQFFVPGFVRWSKVAMPLLVRMSRRVVATSERVGRQMEERLGVGPDRVDIVPPAVGPPFVDHSLVDLDDRPSDYCLFVGGDKVQKNLDFVLGFWPDVHRRLGLRLVVTERAVGSRVLAGGDDPPGVTRVADPTDAELVGLYAGALCLLWPSLHEGFGIPLLEAMATGTPFLSSDCGAAPELAVEPSQVLPLEAGRWVAQLEDWAAGGLGDLRRRSADKARAATWDASAALMLAAIDRSL